ncbi:DgyrCDS6169 [Dimorphilus gyrociliatus]|uniref:DgyrCDS6169 n=1 Tax=Dimorphilus gyrociliatus TaxID=2664684 RepID=A0A7I8VMF0_9ANNE|nr:DgyrCDS6169 [Dimorphilus gyrociliatus]
MDVQRSKSYEAGFEPEERVPMMYPHPNEIERAPDQQMAPEDLPEKMAADEAPENGMDLKPIGSMLWAGLGANLFSLASLIIAFASPFWLQTYPDSFNTFRNIGLWEACFQNYIHYKDDKQEVYDGCWWILNPEDKYWKLREWLLPPWFITCQVLAIASIIICIVTCIMVMAIMLHFCPVLNHEYHQTFTIYFASALSFAKVMLIFIIGTIFGRLSEDWEWMPRPDWNFLSWGYGFLIISGLGSIAAGVCYFMQARDAYDQLKKKEAEFLDIAQNLAASQSQIQLSYQINDDYSQDYPEKDPDALGTEAPVIYQGYPPTSQYPEYDQRYMERQPYS